MTSRTIDTEGIAALLGLTRQQRCHLGSGPSPAASASHASGTMAGTAVSPPSHALMVRSDTPSAWAAWGWV